MLTRNLQTIEKQVKEWNGTYDVHSVFRTIQGEGPFAGQPAVFVRLAGCNLQCPMCDTDYTSGRTEMHVSELRAKIAYEAHNHKIDLLVITGGEPFRQRLGPLIGTYLQSFSTVHIQVETNGTLFDESLTREQWEEITVVCSPKANINFNLIPVITAYKYVMRTGYVDSDDGLPTHALDCCSRPQRPPLTFTGEVYLQPADEGDEGRNRENARVCIESCLKYGYRFSPQLHKQYGLP